MSGSSVLRVSGGPWPWIHLVAFQAAWFGIVYSASLGEHGWAWGVAGGFLGFHLGLARERSKEALRLLVAGALGFMIDSALSLAGALSFLESPLLRPVPLWMVALWLTFAATLPVSIAWLRGRLVLAGVFGLVGGPLSYAAGVRLGALEWGSSLGFGLIAVGIAWALAAPILLVVREFIYRGALGAPSHPI